MYVGNPKELTDKLLGLIRVQQDCQTQIYKESVVFLYTRYEQLGNKKFINI